jgi:hypothetical protein
VGAVYFVVEDGWLIAFILVVAEVGLVVWLWLDAPRFRLDDTGITIRTGTRRCFVPWDCIRSIQLIHRWHSDGEHEDRVAVAKWVVRDSEGDEIFRFGFGTESPEKLAALIREHTGATNWTPPRQTPDPRIARRMQRLFAAPEVVPAEALTCARCGTRVERNEVTRIGAMRVDENTCICPSCLRDRRTSEGGKAPTERTAAE